MTYNSTKTGAEVDAALNGVLQLADSTVTNGNARGTGAVDLQTLRSSAAQVASGARSVVGGGEDNTASGFQSTIGGGYGNTASGERSFIPGGARASTSGLFGAHAWSGEQRATLGDNQHFGLTVQTSTTNATATILTSDRLSPIATNVNVLPDNAVWSGPVWVTARSTGGATAGWLFWCIFKRGAGPGTATLVHSTTVASHVEAALTGVTCTLVANTTRGSAEISVAGLAATTIDWFGEFFGARIHR